jgi:septal ring factor EnvC (AmiA/AmiB activator)
MCLSTLAIYLKRNTILLGHIMLSGVYLLIGYTIGSQVQTKRSEQAIERLNQTTKSMSQTTEIMKQTAEAMEQTTAALKERIELLDQERKNVREREEEEDERRRRVMDYEEEQLEATRRRSHRLRNPYTPADFDEEESLRIFKD